MYKLYSNHVSKPKWCTGNHSFGIVASLQSFQPAAVCRLKSNLRAAKATGSLVLSGVLAFGLYAFSEAAPFDKVLSHPDTISGDAVVVDGDTLDVAGRRVRLHGIDAPELEQGCGRAKQTGFWPAGTHAKRHLIHLIAGRYVRCQIRGTGHYGRLIGVCRSGGIDLNAAMVRRGMAWAYRSYSYAYVPEERQARQLGLGIWKPVACLPAWAYRQQRWAL